MSQKKKSWFRRLGPGFITGAADDDPSGIATYTQVGAQFGFGQLWTAFFTFPLMMAMQEMVGRIGLVTGRGITDIVRRIFPKWVLFAFVGLILLANTMNIGTDLGAMAEVTRLIFPQIPFVILAIGFTALILFLEIFISYQTYAKILKWFALALFSYVITLILVTQNWTELWFNLITPHFQISKPFILTLVAILGTTISPYLFIWQANEEVEEEIAEGKSSLKKRMGATNQEIKEMRRDTAIGMLFSQIIMFCIIATAGSAFFKNGIFDIQSAGQAAQALQPLAGHWASYIFALGVIGTGLLAIPVLSASASYALSEAFGWKEGLYRKFKQAHGFYGVITFATLLGLMINFVGINPIKALIWTAVLNGVVTPPLILIIVKIANDKKVMGKHINGLWSNLFGGIAFLVTSVCVLLLFIL